MGYVQISRLQGIRAGALRSEAASQILVFCEGSFLAFRKSVHQWFVGPREG